MKTYQSKTRRGVLLLVILALLAMFALVAVAFVVLTGRALTGAKQIQRIDQHLDQPDQDLERAAMQILRGTNNPASVIGPHSLLEDVYGQVPIPGLDDDRDGTIDEADEILWYENTIAADLDLTVCGGQLFECTLPGGISRAGSVLTMRTGLAAGQSTRIVGYNFTNSKCQMLAFETGVPQAGDEYVINGTPLSGTGFGYNTATGDLDAVDTAGDLYALLPNPTAFLSKVGYTDPAGPGGANEDYDAVDFQNMLLGAQIPGVGMVATIPSLHRPALVDYWATTGDPTTWGNADTAISGPLHRKVILRPLQAYHPHFTGSNQNFDPAWNGVPGAGITTQWDVDNDGDGVADSVWVDLGMPARSTPDGRLYKPLFAILCLDMDGRLNLNAHGCLAQLDVAYNNGPNAAADSPVIDRLFVDGKVTDVGSPVGIDNLDDIDATAKPFEKFGIRGLGAGPAEINLSPLFESASDPTSTYMYLMTGFGNGTLDGRYGELNLLAGGPWSAPGRTGNEEPLSANKQIGYPDDYCDFDTLTTYATPSDIRGLLSLGLDLSGQPLYAMPKIQRPELYVWWDDSAVDDPYELNLSRNAARGLTPSAGNVDNTFSMAELERLLRPYDRDASRLPSRLARLTSTSPAYNPTDSILFSRRHEITTESWDIPCPNLTRPRGTGVSGQPQHITDLIADKLRASGLSDNEIATQLQIMLAPEVIAGLRMDVNRPLGDGTNNDTNKVVDEPGEADQFKSYGPTGGTLPFFDHDNDGVSDTTDPRPIYARHLYVLMMAVVDLSYLDTLLGQDEAARQIAQWAVNVVDFRDRDSIMTRFAYDPDPFDGWNADGTNVVWGCERPELLITETLAFHDRRTEDKSDFGYVDPPLVTDKKEEDEGDKIVDLDQAYRPQGSLFIELYNPWINHDPESKVEEPPGEFYSPYDQPTETGGGIDLTNAVGGSPVWRLIIVESTGDPEQPDPDDPAAAKPIKRVVYFVDGSGGLPPGGNVQYYPEVPTKIVAVKPGRYAVIGPGGQPDGNKTFIGFDSDSGNAATDRHIVVDPDATTPVEILHNGTTPPTDIHTPVAVVINKPRRLSVSEPVNGYEPLEAGKTDKNGAAITYNPATGKYSNAIDQPIDVHNPDADWATCLGKDGSHTKFRVVHLQRLANPLRAFDVTTNPYLTIDSMAVDLTVFNGRSTKPDHDAAGVELSGSAVMFHTRQRGEYNDDPKLPPGDTTTVNDYNLWKQEPAGKVVTADTTTGGTGLFNRQLKHSLGYLNNEFFGTPRSTPLGAPPKPFPWLTWLNRPFVSQLELLLVPSLRSSKLLVYDEANYYKYYRIVRKTGLDPDTDPDMYSPISPEDVAFPHLLNFFHSSKDPGNSPQFHRVLEFLRVPSKFIGTELQCNPNFAQNGTDHKFNPPYNMISRYREPGRVNLNTIFSADVFRGLLNLPDMSKGLNLEDTGVPPTTLWDVFVLSRRYYGSLSDSMMSIDDTYPTRFGQPFRSFAGAHLAPLDSLKATNEVNSTILRSHPENNKRPLFDVESEYNFNDTDRNPFFRYQGIQRLGNLVTTRSNVYAVWITVGYFEVSPAPINNPAIYPDGYALGAELGSDTGEINRHRAFYMFDRSVPVGFQRGQDLNVEKAVLLRRFIE